MWKVIKLSGCIKWLKLNAEGNQHRVKQVEESCCELSCGNKVSDAWIAEAKEIKMKLVTNSLFQLTSKKVLKNFHCTIIKNYGMIIVVMLY